MNGHDLERVKDSNKNVVHVSENMEKRMGQIIEVVMLDSGQMNTS